MVVFIRSELVLSGGLHQVKLGVTGGGLHQIRIGLRVVVFIGSELVLWVVVFIRSELVFPAGLHWIRIGIMDSVLRSEYVFSGGLYHIRIGDMGIWALCNRQALYISRNQQNRGRCREQHWLGMSW